MKEIDQNVKTYISTYHRASGISKISNEQENNVKNKSFAPIQITVEQILKETYSGSTNSIGGKNSLSRLYESFNFRDADELEDYRIRKRKEFEDSIRRKRWKISLYLSYARWESLQNHIANSRSILERAIIVNYENQRVWREYIKLEITNGNMNNARNLFERVTHLLPRVEEFWIKYLQMELILKNYINVRHIYKNWIAWKPNPNVYIQFSKFEEECGEIESAREVMKSLILSYPNDNSFLEYVRFEQKYKNLFSTEEIINMLIDTFNNIKDAKVTHLFFSSVSDALVEEKQFDEAIELCSRGAEILKDEDSVIYLKEQLFKLYKMRVDQRPDENIEWISHKLRDYHKRLSSQPKNLDLLFDYTVFVFHYLDLDSVLKEYENVIFNIDTMDILDWEKFFYSCLLFVYFFELKQDTNSSNIHKMYNHFINLIKNNHFSEAAGTELEVKSSELDNLNNENNNVLARVLIYFSNHQLRNGDINSARKILGIGLGRTPCNQLFDHYISLESKLGNFDRCRVLFTKYIENDPISATSWIKYMKFEYSLHEIKRVVGIAEAAISMPELDSPEIVWQYYIELMIGENNIRSANDIYRRLLKKTQHIQVVIDYSTFIVSRLYDNKLNREFILETLDKYKKGGMDYQRSVILNYWLELEESLLSKGIDSESKSWVEIINKLLPKTIVDTNTKKRSYVFEEESYDFEHLTLLDKTPESQALSKPKGSGLPISLISAAKQWKKAKI
ncbi:HAT repeat-containing protein [Cryptosporidium canis]|uniref:HAT repeat-containing protein n=1 Tax=Cryptosporidium canis TaxID=195482 RepID=A0A9D5DJD2_9CRYT|nr:HAT repeat-containing protein [Cryptosporidium canis]